jgi:pilus assembly protein FimV
MGSQYGPVKAGDSLSRIAAEAAGGSGQSLDQTMIALLRANPEAFISGNINLLKRGAVLQLPEGEAAGIDAAEATALVQAQTQAWRAQTRRPVQQPAVAGGEGTAAATQAIASAQTASAPNTARRTADARLEIVPPGASNAKRAGTQSGIQAGGEGEMLRQELQQTKETLAARDAEVAEMKARIDELEKLQGQQQQLISMKDTELAAAQKRLADSNQAEAKQPPAGEAGMGPAPWLFGGVALVLAGLAGWWFSRRRTNATATSFRETVTAPKGPSLADAFGPPASARRDTVPARAEPVAPARSEPAWHTQGGTAARAEAGLAATVAQAPGTTQSSDGAERLELARAYIDLGDQDSARNLLAEVLADSDAAVRDRAERMLRELG